MSDRYSLGTERAAASKSDRSDGGRPKPSPHALAAFEALFKKLPSAEPSGGDKQHDNKDRDSKDRDSAAEAAQRADEATVPASQQSSGESVGGTSAGEGATIAASQSAAAPRPGSAAETFPSVPRVDRPKSPFHVYEWVVDKLRAKPSTTFLEIRKLALIGNFEVSEGHYKRARQTVADELPTKGNSRIDAIVQDTIALVRQPVEEYQRLRRAAEEIAAICDRALASLEDPS